MELYVSEPQQQNWFYVGKTAYDKLFRKPLYFRIKAPRPRAEGQLLSNRLAYRQMQFRDPVERSLKYLTNTGFIYIKSRISGRFSDPPETHPHQVPLFQMGIFNSVPL